MTDHFLSYPSVREGPSVPYKNETQSAPVLRGTQLAIAATLIHNVGFLQSHLWTTAGFNVIHDIPYLDQYPGRSDPTVIPVETTKSDLVVESTVRERKGSNTYYTSADYHALYLSGDLTPTTVIETLLPLVRRDIKPPGTHSTAFVESQVDIILAAAKESTQRYQKGESLGLLDGVPVAIKDEVHLTGYTRTLGTKLDFKAGIETTSWCVQQWQDAGAIVIGKTTMHELGLDTNNNNPNFGTPRNPHNGRYYCGGSSGGSGYAVGAGLVPIALGADGGGSIRIPSSFCGIWGLKPTHARVSAAPSPSLAPSVGVIGPMAASIDDLALAYRIMAKPPPTSQDPIASQFPIPVPAAPNRTRPKTIGICRDWIDRAEAPVRAVFDAALAHYREIGYEVVDIEIPYLMEGQRAHTLTIMAEISSGIELSQIRHLTAPNKVLVSIGANQIKARDFLAAQRLRALLMDHFAYLFITHPGIVIFTPTTPLPGWRIESEAELTHGLSDGKATVRNMEYVWLANFTGCPAITCPSDYDRRTSVPIGVMAMGEWGAEEDLIEFARDGETILELATNFPPASSEDPSQGLRIPCNVDSNWEDVIAKATTVAST